MSVVLALIVVAVIGVIFIPLGRRIGAQQRASTRLASEAKPPLGLRFTIVGVLGLAAVVAWIVWDSDDYIALAAIVAIISVVQLLITRRWARQTERSGPK